MPFTERTIGYIVSSDFFCGAEWCCVLTFGSLSPRHPTTSLTHRYHNYYLLCVGDATKVGDKAHLRLCQRHKGDAQSNQSRNQAAQRCLYLICIAGEPSPAPPSAFLIVCHYPCHYQYLQHQSYHSYHNYYLLCVDIDSATKVDDKAYLCLAVAAPSPAPLPLF